VKLRNAVLGLSAALTLPLFAVSKNDVVVVTPATVNISLVDGKGAGTFSLLVSKEVEVDIELGHTAAVSATGDTIEQKDIQLGNKLRIKKSPTPEIVQLTFTVTASRPLAANTPYNGKILVFTDERQDIPFTINQPVATSFEVDPKTITTHLSTCDSGLRPVRIRSTSPVSLGQVEISSLGFSSSKGIAIPYAPRNPRVAMPGKSTTAELDLPYPKYAGTYTGIIDVISPNSDKQSVSVTFTIRGPFGKTAVPIVLFFVVLLLGFFLSEGLENWWSERRLEELEVERELGRARPEIAAALALLKRWADAKATLPKTTFAFRAALDQLDQTLKDIRALPSDQLRQQVAAAVNVARAASAFVAEMENISPAPETAKAADEVLLSSPTYRTDLHAAISAADEPKKVWVVPKPKTKEDVDRQIRKIRGIRGFIVLFVVALTAHQTFFAPDPQFGTAADYVKVFFWSLGFTQAGAQIITRIRSMSI
jgi:hypothetical protein